MLCAQLHSQIARSTKLWDGCDKIMPFYWFSNHKMINDSFLSWEEEAVGVDSGDDFVGEGFVGAFE